MLVGVYFLSLIDSDGSIIDAACFDYALIIILYLPHHFLCLCVSHAIPRRRCSTSLSVLALAERDERSRGYFRLEASRVVVLFKALHQLLLERVESDLLYWL